MAELKSFIRSVLEERGGLVEERPDGSYALFLPGEVARKIGTDEFVELDFSSSPENPERIHVTYGSELLDRIAGLAGTEGHFAGYSIPGLYTKKENLEKEIFRKLQFRIPRFSYAGSSNAFVAYLLFNFRYTVMADERRDGLLPLCLNCSSGARIEEMESLLVTHQAGGSMNLDHATIEKLPLDRIYEKASREARLITERELADYSRSAHRRMQRDLARVDRYYETLLAELEKRYRKRTLEPEKASEKEDRRKAIELEYLLKRKDIEKKYTIEIKLSLINACLVILPAVACQVRVTHRKESRMVQVFWNSLIKGIEPLVCDRCMGDTTAVHTCPRLHLTCESCHSRCGECR